MVRKEDSRASKVGARVASENIIPRREDRAEVGGSPGRVGHVGCDNARSVSLRRCNVAVTYPGGAFRGLYVGVGSGSHYKRAATPHPLLLAHAAKLWKRDCRIRA